MKLSDMLFANAMMGEGGGGGGGGGDFSTAQVTVINNNDVDYAPQFSTPVAFEENAMGEGSPACVYGNIYVPANETAVFTVPLYKGLCMWGNAIDVSEISGNITTHGSFLLITGDGSITIPVSV